MGCRNIQQFHENADTDRQGGVEGIWHICFDRPGLLSMVLGYYNRTGHWYGQTQSIMYSSGCPAIGKYAKMIYKDVTEGFE